ncbi:MAG: hypothetical protein KJO07_09285, partial [Deltaproteobacteria bacterium]|nr:hypothetical protein [Deltaproteobacteria bacterium]
PAGRYHLVVRSTAFGDSPLDSIFAPLVQLSDPGRYRLGIGRARLGQQVADPSLSLRSDGTRPFARDSRPFASDGSATRRWAIVESGKLSGLALDNHFGALLGRESNGGVGNLELVMAREPMASLIAPDELPVLVIDAAAWRRADPATGALTMAIRAGRVVRSDGATTDVRGGVASTGSELFDRARGSLEDAISSWFAGPAAIHLGVVSVV